MPRIKRILTALAVTAAAALTAALIAGATAAHAIAGTDFVYHW